MEASWQQFHAHAKYRLEPPPRLNEMEAAASGERICRRRHRLEREIVFAARSIDLRVPIALEELDSDPPAASHDGERRALLECDKAIVEIAIAEDCIECGERRLFPGWELSGVEQ
jgi:hypothetical protein